MNVITISRQYGSEGNVIADAVAARLGFKLVTRELVNQAALRAGAPSVALAVIDELHLLGIKPTPLEYQAYIEAVKTVMEELAARGNVIIVGRGGQVLLRSHPGVLNVRIVAPFDLRVQRLAGRNNISLQAAAAQVRASDRERRNYLKRFFNSDWNDPFLYDLVINTAHVTAAVACDLICQAARQHE